MPWGCHRPERRLPPPWLRRPPDRTGSRPRYRGSGQLVARREVQVDRGVDEQCEGDQSPDHQPARGQTRGCLVGGAHLTTRVPIMFAWNVKPNGYLPGLAGDVKVAVPPSAPTVRSKAPGVVEVRMWFWLSWFLMVTFAPGATGAGTEYMKLLIVMSTGCAAPGELDGAVADVEDRWGVLPAVWEPEAVAEAPQPLSRTTSAAAAMVNSPALMLMSLAFLSAPVARHRRRNGLSTGQPAACSIPCRPTWSNTVVCLSQAGRWRPPMTGGRCLLIGAGYFPVQQARTSVVTV